MVLVIAIIKQKSEMINNQEALPCLKELLAQGNRLKERDLVNNLYSGVDNEKFDEVAEEDCRVRAKINQKTAILNEFSNYESFQAKLLETSKKAKLFVQIKKPNGDSPASDMRPRIQRLCSFISQLCEKLARCCQS